jgi:adenylate kinase family enzyme
VVLGKTTLSDSLGEVLNLPVCHIDGIHHLENWEIRDKAERDKIILEKVKEEKWIIDGTYRSTLKTRLENSDLVIFLDYSSISQLKGVLGRFIKNHGKEKPEIPGCKEKMSFEFFIWVLNWRKNKRNEIMENLNKIDKNKILIFKNRSQLNKWFYNEFNKKII